jgi:hypothetical protein
MAFSGSACQGFGCGGIVRAAQVRLDPRTRTGLTGHRVSHNSR